MFAVGYAVVVVVIVVFVVVVNVNVFIVFSRRILTPNTVIVKFMIISIRIVYLTLCNLCIILLY